MNGMFAADWIPGFATRNNFENSEIYYYRSSDNFLINHVSPSYAGPEYNTMTYKMTAVVLVPWFTSQFFYANGQPMAGELPIVYQAGTVKPINTLTDSLAHSQIPILWLQTRAVRCRSGSRITSPTSSF